MFAGQAVYRDKKTLFSLVICRKGMLHRKNMDSLTVDENGTNMESTRKYIGNNR